MLEKPLGRNPGHAAASEALGMQLMSARLQLRLMDPDR
jgi:hypothetical protein